MNIHVQHPPTGRLAIVSLLLAVVLATTLIVFGSNGPRGTDQYNYFSDSITLLEDREPLTTLHFPARLIRDAGNESPNYFTHHGPTVALAAWLGQKTGIGTAWLVINLASHLFVGWVIWLCCRRLVSGNLASFAAAFYLLSPIALWQSMNILQEQFFSALTALIVLGYVYRDKPVAHLALLLGLFVGVLSHPLYLVLLAAYIVYCLLCCATANSITQAVSGVAYTLVVAALGAWLKTQGASWFPTTFQPNIAAIITSALPDTNSNMHWHYSLEQVPITAELLLAKLKVAARLHFIDVKSVPFFAFTNLAVVALFALLVTHGKQYWKLLLGLGLIFGVYASILVLMQNQVRYQQMVAPATFIILALAMNHMPKLLRQPVLLALCLIPLVAVGGYLAHYSQSETLREANSLKATASNFNDVLPRTARVVAIDVVPHSPMAYTLKPREVLSIRSDMLDSDNIDKAISLFQATHLVAKATSVDVVNTSQWKVQSEFASPYFGELQIFTAQQ